MEIERLEDNDYSKYPKLKVTLEMEGKQPIVFECSSFLGSKIDIRDDKIVMQSISSGLFDGQIVVAHIQTLKDL